MKRPLTCPVCGSKITRITNAVTNQSYFRCSNRECHFVLAEEYTDAEFYLQGTTMSTCCLKCGEPLTVANGPYGLHARCFKCDCDLKPIKFNGKVYQKWVNARRDATRSEIESMVESFNAKSEDDKMYDFDEYISIAQPKKEKAKKTSEKKHTEDTNTDKILSVLGSCNKSLSAEEISKLSETQINSIHTSLLSLRTLGKIKIVDFRPNRTGNHTLLYQLAESNLPELKIYTKEEGYNTVNAFIEENKDKYQGVVRQRETLRRAIHDNQIPSIVFQNARGICAGYAIKDMKRLMDIATGVKPAERAKITEKTETVEKVVPVKKSSKEEKNVMKNQVLAFLQKNLEKSYTITGIAKQLKFNELSTRNIVRDLRKNKKIKIVGWDYRKGEPGANALRYQLTESSLPRLKTTIDNNLYMTAKQFYIKKLKGKRCPSSEIMKKVQELPVTPLIVNQRAYAGYSVADLKKVFKEYLDSSISTKRTCRAAKKKTSKETSVPVKTLAGGMVSDPVKVPKKSIFGTIFSSLIGKK